MRGNINLQATSHLATRGLKVVALGLAAIFAALFAVPLSVISPGGQDAPLVSFFLTGIREQLLPAGWRLITVSPYEHLQVYVAASLVMALLLGSPLIAFEIFNRIVPRDAHRRRTTICSLIALSSVAFGAGALLGYYFLATYLLAAGIPFPVP
jgi:Sec-independent protein secretion pathway component TatC